MPITIPIFSATSKKLKYEAVSSVLGSYFAYVERLNDCIPPMTKPTMAAAT